MKIKLLIALCSLTSLSACSLFVPPPSANVEAKKTFNTATRQLAPEPVYNRVRWVHLPEPLPSKETNLSTTRVLPHSFEINLKNSSLEQVARALAAAKKYRSYCAASIAEIRVDLQGIGTIEEFAAIIEQKTGIKVTIDHDMRDIRFLAGNYTAPRFFEDEDLNEHKPINTRKAL